MLNASVHFCGNLEDDYLRMYAHACSDLVTTIIIIRHEQISMTGHVHKHTVHGNTHWDIQSIECRKCI